MSTTVLSRPRSSSVAAPARRRLLALAALVVLAAAVYAAFIAPIRQVDLDVFLRAGQAVLHGHDPYSSTHSETIRTNAAFVYPLAVAWWFAPLSTLGASHVIYAIASLIAIGAACWWARPGQPLIAALVLLCSATLIGLQDGSVNPWLLLGLIAAWRWRNRPVVGGLAVAALVICKLFLWPVLGWLLLSRRYCSAAIAMVVTGLTLGLGFIFGPLGGSGYASMLHVLSGLEAPHAAGLSGLLIHWHASLALATVIATGVALLLMAAAGYMYRRGPQNDGREVFVFGAAVVAALFASPIVWHHYYLLLAAPLLLATRSVWPFVVMSLAGWAAAAPHATTPVHTALGYVLGLGGIAAIAVIAAVRAWRQAPSRDNALTRAYAAFKEARPVAVVAALAVLIIVVVSAMQKVSVRGGWGALVTVVETAGVLAYVWSRRADNAQVDLGLVRSN